MWNKIKNLFSRGVEVEDPDDYMTIWGVTDGPMTDDEGESWFVVAKVSIDEEVFFTNIYSETFPEAYEFAKHFKTNFDPIKIRIGEVYED
jgi:hypothetical protein